MLSCQISVDLLISFRSLLFDCLLGFGLTFACEHSITRSVYVYVPVSKNFIKLRMLCLFLHMNHIFSSFWIYNIHFPFFAKSFRSRTEASKQETKRWGERERERETETGVSTATEEAPKRDGHWQALQNDWERKCLNQRMAHIFFVFFFFRFENSYINSNQQGNVWIIKLRMWQSASVSEWP